MGLKQQIEIILKGKDAGASQSLDNVKGKVGGLQAAGKSLIGVLTGPLGVAAAVGIATHKLTGMFTGMAELADQTAKTSRRIGLSGEQYQKYAFHAKIAGTNTGILTSALTVLQRNLFDISVGSGLDAERAFRSLGIAALDATGGPREVNDVVQDLARVLPTLDNAALRTGAMMKILGRSGSDLANFFEGGPDAIRKSAEDLERLGGVMSADLTRNAEEYADAVLRMQTSFDGLKRSLLGPLLPSLREFADTTATIISLGRGGPGRGETQEFQRTQVFGSSQMLQSQRDRGLIEAPLTTGPVFDAAQVNALLASIPSRSQALRDNIFGGGALAGPTSFPHGLSVGSSFQDADVLPLDFNTENLSLADDSTRKIAENMDAARTATRLANSGFQGIVRSLREGTNLAEAFVNILGDLVVSSVSGGIASGVGDLFRGGGRSARSSARRAAHGYEATARRNAAEFGGVF